MGFVYIVVLAREQNDLFKIETHFVVNMSRKPAKNIFAFANIRWRFAGVWDDFINIKQNIDPWALRLWPIFKFNNSASRANQGLNSPIEQFDKFDLRHVSVAEKQSDRFPMVLHKFSKDLWVR